jgi:hypothetical protein
MARPFPHVIQLVQRAAERIFGQPPFGGDLQNILEQGDRPTHVRVAESLGRISQQRRQQVLFVFAQRRGASPSRLVLERRRVVGMDIDVNPVVNTLPGHAEHAGQVAGGAPVVEFQDGKRASEEARIAGFRELTLQALSLPRG